MENAILSAQAANTNRIRELEKQVASITTKLQKVRQQLTTAPHNKLHSKSADKATPATPPATLRVTTPAAPCPQKPLDISENPTENLSWADHLNASISQHDKPFTTLTLKNKKPIPATIITKALPCTDREVIITIKVAVTDAIRAADYSLKLVNKAITESADITMPPFILARITSNNRIVLITNPTTKVAIYMPYLQILANATKCLKPVETKINECWSKFLLHNVPTNAKLSAVKAEIESTYP
jgi:hypothetical protein